MTWRVSCLRVGYDQFQVSLANEHQESSALISLGGLQQLRDEYGLVPPPAVLDLLTAAVAVYAADLRIPRAGSFDDWTRDIVLHFPVSDSTGWAHAESTLKETLEFLTGDHWTINTVRSSPSSHKGAKVAGRPLPNKVSLFSGGLDSFVGAIDLVESGDLVGLVGHYSNGATHGPQHKAFAVLDDRYRSRAHPFWFYVQPPRSLSGYTESTTRSRSFLFLALGVTVAAAIGDEVPLIVPENGLISLNVPLTVPRMGSLSTRTTHPFYIARYRDLLKNLNLGTDIINPYQFRTKGEMVKDVRNPELLFRNAHVTMSCSHPTVSRFAGEGRPIHCGYCVPCIIRRAALKGIGLENERFAIDILNAPPPATARRGRDLRAFQMAIERHISDGADSPLTRILATGPLPGDQDDIREYVGVYNRGMEEVRRLLRGDVTGELASTTTSFG